MRTGYAAIALLALSLSGCDRHGPARADVTACHQQIMATAPHGDDDIIDVHEQRQMLVCMAQKGYAFQSSDTECVTRSAGLRTFPLVAMASCGFVQATETLLVDSPEAVARVVEGIITGIGFIGGGAILKDGLSVRGTATAASIWATGCIGTAVGLAVYDVAIVIAIMTFLTLKLLPILKDDNTD